VTDERSTDQPIVIAERLGKRFKLYANPWHRAAEWLTLGAVSKHSDFWAVRDVSFSVRRGECFGVLGHNGSGKSTLLKILSGAMHANAGTFAIHGRVLSLLELGTGLNHELTGRQNVLQGAELLGFPPGYGTQKVGEIEAFSELGAFFDRPVRTYSSGMLVRLAFSMFACFEPDVFIVDEALSVGDVFFQQKCVARIEQMLSNGVTMLFVSHDMQLVQRLCDRAMVLSHGQTAFTGPADEAVARYYSLLGQTLRAPGPANTDATDAAPAAILLADVRQGLIDNDILPCARARHGEGRLRLIAATLANAHGQSGLIATQGDPIVLRVLLTAAEPFERPSCGIHLYDRLGNLVFAAGTKQQRVPLPPMSAGDERIITFRLTLDVQPGEYTLSVGCSESTQMSGAPDVGVIQDQHEGLGPIAVHPTGETPPRYYGIAKLPLDITLE
jgi:ABC-type polysaccharide/polyol phosphate transport system ATPase subunit